MTSNVLGLHIYIYLYMYIIALNYNLWLSYAREQIETVGENA